jgi:hypothetical protein
VDTTQTTVDSPIYFNVIKSGGYTYIDYWVFYSYNDSPALPSLTCLGGLSIADLTCFDHEGDWEGIAVRLDGNVTPGPLHARPRSHPSAVIYAAHKGTALFAWDRLTAIGATSGDHPFAYVASGSHASYPLACGAASTPKLSCRQLGSDLPDGRRDGMGTWPRNPGAGCTGCVRPFPQDSAGKPIGWATFRGRWGLASCTVGLKLCSRSEGPPTPTFQARDQRPGTGAVPCDARLPTKPGGALTCRKGGKR